MVGVLTRMSLATDDLQRGGYSSSPGLSSPPSPNSPTHHSGTPTSFAQDAVIFFAQNDQNDANVGIGKSGKAIAAKNTSVTKRPRKKKDPETTKSNTGNASTTATDVQEKPRQRAPRGTSDAFKKRQAKIQAEREAQAARGAEALQGSRQTKTDPLPSPSVPPAHFDVPAIHTPPQNGNNEAIPTPHINTKNLAGQSRPTSGQNYDPIRSSTTAPRASSPLAPSHTPQKLYKAASASASPSINRLIDPPQSDMSSYVYTPQLKRESDGKTSSPQEQKRPRLSPPIPVLAQQPFNPSPTSLSVTMPQQHRSPATVIDLDTEKPPVPSTTTTTGIKKPSPKASTGVSSSSHSPKPTRPKEAPLALPPGSGLLSGSIFGGGYDSSGPEKTAPTVVLNVKLDGDNQYVNFTRLAEEQYGFNALHPRLAAQRERLARVAAAGAALENAHKNGGNSGSGDEMSVDLSDGDADNSNVEMGGMVDGERMIGKSGEETGEAGAAKKPIKKRMMKEDMYDKEDDFIDDTELIWEEQAATSKDGFFVYSGPLIPPGEEPAVERSALLCLSFPRIILTFHRAGDGPAKRGRGTGRGRGGTTRGGARAAAASKDGTKAPAKAPVKRVSKAAKEQMEREKAQRENLAVLASKPAGYHPVPV